MKCSKMQSCLILLEGLPNKGKTHDSEIKKWFFLQPFQNTWKSHKAFCKMKDPFLNPTTSTQSEPKIPPPPEKIIEDTTAKEPISVI